MCYVYILTDSRLIIISSRGFFRSKTTQKVFEILSNLFLNTTHTHNSGVAIYVNWRRKSQKIIRKEAKFHNVFLFRDSFRSIDTCNHNSNNNNNSNWTVKNSTTTKTNSTHPQPQEQEEQHNDNARGHDVHRLGLQPHAGDHGRHDGRRWAHGDAGREVNTDWIAAAAAEEKAAAEEINWKDVTRLGPHLPVPPPPSQQPTWHPRNDDVCYFVFHLNSTWRHCAPLWPTVTHCACPQYFRSTWFNAIIAHNFQLVVVVVLIYL